MNAKSEYKECTKLVTTLVVAVVLNGMAAFGSLAADLGALTEGCSHCHGKDGASKESTVPNIGGLSEFYIVDNMAVYKDKARPCVEAEYLGGPDKGKKTDMCQIAAKLGDKDIEALGKFYSGKAFVPAKQSFDADKAARGQKIHDANCEKCHAEGGVSAEDDAGVLAGQWTGYLEHTFKLYASGERNMPKKMIPKMEKLSAEATEELLHYYASQQ